MYGDATKGTITSVEGGEKTKIWLSHKVLEFTTSVWICLNNRSSRSNRLFFLIYFSDL